MKEVTIKYGAGDGYEVIQDGKTSGKLTFGELIEQLASLSFASERLDLFATGRPCFAMKPVKDER